jgi:hypothetical protein
MNFILFINTLIYNINYIYFNNKTLKKNELYLVKQIQYEWIQWRIGWKSIEYLKLIILILAVSKPIDLILIIILSFWSKSTFTKLVFLITIIWK